MPTSPRDDTPHKPPQAEDLTPDPLITHDEADARLNAAGQDSMYQKVRRLNERQRHLVELLLAGKDPAEACRLAGYASQGPLRTLQNKIPDLLDRLGLSDETLVEQHLKPLLSAHEVRFFKSSSGMYIDPNGVAQECDQVIETPPRPALDIRLRALDMSFKLRGSYAPPREPEDLTPRDINVQIINVGGG